MSEAYSPGRAELTSAPRCTGLQAGTAWGGTLGWEQDPASAFVGSHRASTWTRQAQTPRLMQKALPGLPPQLTLAQRGGRCHSRGGGRRPGSFPGDPTSKAWEGFVGRDRIGWAIPRDDHVLRDISRRGTQAKAQGTQTHRLLCGYARLHAPCKPPPGLCGIIGHLVPVISSLPIPGTSQEPLSSTVCKPRLIQQGEAQLLSGSHSSCKPLAGGGARPGHLTRVPNSFVVIT